MSKSQLLREVARQQRGRHPVGVCTNWIRNGYGMNTPIGRFSAKLDDLSEGERALFKTQISKQLERERRLHKARSFLYSVSRHIQLYTALKFLETK